MDAAAHPSATSVKPRSGYTYIEALIVAMVIGILTAMMVPSYHRAADTVRLRTAMRVLATDLRRVVAVAQSRRRPIDIWYDDDLSALVAQFRGDSVLFLRRALTTDDVEWRVRQVRLEPTTIHVLPGGRLSFPGVITLSTPSQDRQLKISSLGVVAPLTP